jgi:hypothetical protein
MVAAQTQDSGPAASVKIVGSAHSQCSVTCGVSGRSEGRAKNRIITVVVVLSRQRDFAVSRSRARLGALEIRPRQV